MPIYDYKCNECGTTYDIFHKVREVAGDVVCPSCGSPKHTRLISAPSVAIRAKQADAPACGEGGCCGGSCSLN